MTIKDWLRNKMLKFLGLEKMLSNPNDKRLTFISDDEAIKTNEIKANRVWYLGSGDELLNFYTEQQVSGLNDNSIYNRNKRNYFWGLSADECDIKRIHSGIPNAIISTLSNVIGMPEIHDEFNVWEKIARENDFENKLTQQARPLTMAEGYGAWKVNFNKDLSKYPLIEFYEAEYVEYIYKCGILIGIIFKSFYKKGNKDYVLFETRYRSNGNSYIEFDLFELKKSNEIEKVDFDSVDELKDFDGKTKVIENFDKILAVPSRYFYDPQNPKYGRSIYSGKLDLFDMLDEILSQASQTNRVSTPVEYYDPDVLERGKNGAVGMPNVYNRQFIKKASIPDGDGNVNSDIVTTQPDLNFDKYGGLAKTVLDYILTGVLSPATMGIDVAKKDNADAQREKEKVTIQTRNNVISQETNQLRQLVELCLSLLEYMETEDITLVEHNIDIKYNEFATPTFENQIQVLGSAWGNGQLSTEKYVNLLWTDKLSEEEKQKEIEWLDGNREKDNLQLGDFENEAPIGAGYTGESQEQEEVGIGKGQPGFSN